MRTYRHERPGINPLQVEQLEPRCLPTTMLFDGMLLVIGTPRNDVIDVYLAGAADQVCVSENHGTPRCFLLREVAGVDVTGGSRNDHISIRFAQRPVTVDGGSGHDALIAAEGDDFLFGGSGNDSIVGGDGDDTLDGGKGNDTLNGESGDDVLWGQSGRDVLWGGRGQDELDGGRGNDSLSGEDGDDTVFGGLGADVLSGGTGNDDLAGYTDTQADPARDVADGGDDDDTYFGASFATLTNIEFFVPI